MTYKEAKAYRGSGRKAKVVSSILSPTKHDIGQTIEIVGASDKNPFLLWTGSGALVDYRDIEFF